MAVLCWGTASAQWTTTVQWDEPGSVVIKTGSSAGSSTPMDMPASATSMTLTEAKAYKVKFSFTNGDPNCLNNIRDWAAGKFIMPSELTPGYVLDIVKGGEIQFNFNKDYTNISVTANGAALENPGGRKIAINEDTEFVITATGITYEDVEALIYCNDIEHLMLISDLDKTSSDIHYEFVKDVPAGSVTLASGYTIPIETKLYKATRIPGKTKKFFFEVANGYWLRTGVVSHREYAEDASDYFLAGTTMINASDAPVFLDVQKIDYTNTIYVYYEGPENGAKIMSKTNDGLFSTFEGPEMLKNGWNTIKYDPEYNAVFSGGMFVDYETANYTKTVILDGKAVQAGDDGVYGFNFNNNSVLKMFLTPNAVTPYDVNITAEGYAPATVVYDMCQTVSEFPATVKVYGATDFVITPGVNVVAKVNGADATLADGKYTAAMKSAGTIALSQNMANATLAADLIPADKSKVRKLAKITYNIPFDGEHAADIAADAAKYITLTPAAARAAGINPESVEAGDPSDTAIPVVITFPVQDAAGEYTLDIPAGIFQQTGWNDAAESFLPTGIVNAPVQATYTVDPTMEYTWSFSPANGSVNPYTGNAQMIVMSLPDAESLSSDAFTEATGTWVKFNGVDVKKVDDADAEEGWSYIETMATYGKPAVAILVSESIMKYNGTLEINAEAGALTVDGNEASPAISYSAQFGENKTYEVTTDPESGTEVTEFNEIKVTFNGAETVAINEGNVYIQFNNGTQWGRELNASDVTIEGNTAILNVKTDVTLVPGIYRLTIDAGTFVLDGQQLSDDISASWELVRSSEVDQTWQPIPATGVMNYGYGMDVAFVFGEIESVSYGDNIGDIKVVFDGQELPQYDPSKGDEVEYYRTALEPYMPNVIMISAAGGKFLDKTTEGKLTVTIPVGGIKISGVPNSEEISYTWNLITEKEYTVTLTPADGNSVKELTEVKIEFNGIDTVELSEYFQNSWVGVRKGYSVIANAASVTKVEDATVPTFIVTIDKPITENGTYDFTIYSDAFLINGVQSSKEIAATYYVDDTLTGINGIYSENGLYTVVTLQGIVVLRDASADKVKALPAGFYIINGQKVNLR